MFVKFSITLYYLDEKVREGIWGIPRSYPERSGNLSGQPMTNRSTRPHVAQNENGLYGSVYERPGVAQNKNGPYRSVYERPEVAQNENGLYRSVYKHPGVCQNENGTYGSVN